MSVQIQIQFRIRILDFDDQKFLNFTWKITPFYIKNFNPLTSMMDVDAWTSFVLCRGLKRQIWRFLSKKIFQLYLKLKLKSWPGTRFSKIPASGSGFSDLVNPDPKHWYQLCRVGRDKTLQEKLIALKTKHSALQKIKFLHFFLFFGPFPRRENFWIKSYKYILMKKRPFFIVLHQAPMQPYYQYLILSQG